MCQLLVSTGLDVAVESEDVVRQKGDGDHEVALVIRDAARVPVAMREIASFLGCGIDRAREIVCASPAVLIGNISLATAIALRDRFEPIDVELDVSCPKKAIYDIYIVPLAPLAQQAVLNTIRRELGRSLAPRGSEPIMVPSLAYTQVSALLKQLKPIKAAITVCNRDFQRFDIRLDHAPPNDDLREFLTSGTLIPVELVDKMIANTPLIVRQHVPFHEMEVVIAGIAQRGGRATALPLSFQWFSLKIEKSGDRSSSVRILKALGGLTRRPGREGNGRQWRNCSTSNENIGPLDSRRTQTGRHGNTVLDNNMTTTVHSPHDYFTHLGLAEQGKLYSLEGNHTQCADILPRGDASGGFPKGARGVL